MGSLRDENRVESRRRGCTASSRSRTSCRPIWRVCRRGKSQPVPIWKCRRRRYSAKGDEYAKCRPPYDIWVERAYFVVCFIGLVTNQLGNLAHGSDAENALESKIGLQLEGPSKVIG